MAEAEVRELQREELADWDVHAVDAPGGHVYQSRAWAGHREARGWRPRFLATGALRALVLTKPWPGLPGGFAYLPRGPVGPEVPWASPGAPAGEHAGRAVGGMLVAVTRWLASDGVDVLAADPEVAEDDETYGRILLDGGFHAVPEIQPSRHRMALRLDGADEPAVLGAITKATRQRIRQAERAGIVVVRHDTRRANHEGFVRPASGSLDTTLALFHGLMVETGRRRGFDFPGPGDFLGWWRSGMEAGHVVHLEARDGGAAGEVLGGLLLYRHGLRLSTRHAADLTSSRRTHPGTMHLLRWRAIQLAIAEGCQEMDLGGVDIAGARRMPRPGDSTYGLYAHKRSFGAEWVALAGAHERVERPWRCAAGRAAARAARAARARRATGRGRDEGG